METRHKMWVNLQAFLLEVGDLTDDLSQTVVTLTEPPTLSAQPHDTDGSGGNGPLHGGRTRHRSLSVVGWFPIA